VTDASSDTGKCIGGMIARGMVLKYCRCGHPIGIEHPSDPYRFYDSGDWNKQVETCPSCGCVIEAEGLDFSEEQAACLARVYRLLRSWAREAEQSTE
jgi:hypothetical protein